MYGTSTGKHALQSFVRASASSSSSAELSGTRMLTWYAGIMRAQSCSRRADDWLKMSWPRILALSKSCSLFEWRPEPWLFWLDLSAPLFSPTLAQSLTWPSRVPAKEIAKTRQFRRHLIQDLCLGVHIPTQPIRRYSAVLSMLGQSVPVEKTMETSTHQSSTCAAIAHVFMFMSSALWSLQHFKTTVHSQVPSRS